jgi:DNA-binding MarR family transcriptional regulator
MAPRSPHRLPPEPPPAIMEAFRKRLPARDLPALGVVVALRTAAQQAENAITQWMAGTVGSPARFQILGLLWASEERGVPHKEIVAALGVTRATVSGLMAALERDGLVTSTVDSDDRRNLIANLTTRGRTVMEKAVEANAVRLRAALAPLSADDLRLVTALLQRIRQGFAATSGKDDHSAKHSSRACREGQ